MKHLTALTLAAALASSGCSEVASALRRDKPPGALPPNAVRVTVEVVEQVADDAWEVSWTFSRPVDGARFVDEGSRYRAEGWQLEGLHGGDAAWAAVDLAELVVPAGGPLRGFTARFATAPELHVALGDGGRLIQIGQLAVVPLLCQRPHACAPEELEPPKGYIYHRWRLRTAPSRDVLIAGQASVGAVDWDQPRGSHPRGLYAWFGEGAPSGGPALDLVVDRALPAWMIESAETHLAGLLSRYASATGQALARKPTVLLSAADPAVPGRYHAGQTLHDQVQLAARGAGWAADSPANRRAWLRLLAHQSFHLWNAERFRLRAGQREAWIVEGGAAWWSRWALAQEGLLEGRELERWVVESTNRCLIELGGAPLAEAALTGRGAAIAPCGVLAHALIDGARRDHGGVASLYRDVWAAAAAAEGRYGAAELLAGALGAGEVVSRLVGQGIDVEADKVLAGALQGAGWPARLVDPRQAELPAAEYLELLADALTECDCGAPRHARVEGGALVFQGHSSCQVLRDGFALASLDGHPVVAEPAAAWWALAEAARDIRRFELTPSGGGVAPTKKCPVAVLDPTWTELLELSP